MKNIILFSAVIMTAVLGVMGQTKVKLGDVIKDGRPQVRWRGFNLKEMLSID